MASGMFARLGHDNLLLDALQQLLSFGQAQTEIADLVEIAGPVDLHHIDAPEPTCGIRLHQTQDPAHAFSPGRISGRIIGHFGATPNFSAVPAMRAHLIEIECFSDRHFWYGGYDKAEQRLLPLTDGIAVR
jgi:hypothetical protein